MLKLYILEENFKKPNLF